MKKHLSSLLLCVGIAIGVFAAMTATASATVVDSGACGENLTWVLDDEGTLTISGEGEMDEWDWEGNPWSEYHQSIIKVNIEDGVTSIGSWAFTGCRELISVTVPDSIVSIGDRAFWDCESLALIMIPNSVRSIGEWAFAGCWGLTTITIPSSVTSIGNGAFVNCARLTDISVATDNPAFSSFDGVLYNKDKTTLICYSRGKVGSFTIPDSVTSIGDEAFYQCFELTSVMIPDNVMSIGNRAFYQCSELTSVKIPDNVTSIGDEAFYWCTGLTSITIPDGVTSIGYRTFCYCFSLMSITIPDSITSVGNDAFYNCEAYSIFDDAKYFGNAKNPYLVLYEASVGSSIHPNTKVIANSAFYNCTGLTSVVIPDGVTNIGANAFGHCTELTSIAISDSVTSIGDCAFLDCTGLTSITIPDSVTGIGDLAFWGCTGLTSITISDSVTSIGESAFYNCLSLTNVYYNGKNAQWNEVEIDRFNQPLYDATIYFSCGDDLWWTLTDGVTLTISGEGAMENFADSSEVPWYDYRKDVQSIIFCSGVTRIGNNAFRGFRSLKSVTIPSSVSRIGDYAFADCDTLTDVQFFGGDFWQWNAISIGWSNEVLENAALSIPYGIQILSKKISGNRTDMIIAANVVDANARCLVAFYNSEGKMIASKTIATGSGIWSQSEELAEEPANVKAFMLDYSFVPLCASAAATLP